MAKRKWGLRNGALLVLCAQLVCVLLFPLPVQASSATQDTSGSGASGASDTSGAEPQKVPEGQGLYFPEDFEPQAEAVCIVNEDTGLVAYEKNADTPMAAASLVKMMTCILVAERITDLDNTLIVANQSWIFDDLAEYRERTGAMPSHADIRNGETLSARELLYAALLPSGNEAAMILADYVCGGYMPNFIYMMNARAASLGCTGTTFTDTCGLAEDNVTTARDVVLIARGFMQVPQLVEIAQAGTYEMAAHEKHSAAYTIHTTNRLIVQTSPYYKAFPSVAGAVVAGKTGSLAEWQNYASKASKGGESYICAVLHSPNAADVVGAALDPVQNRPALYESAQLYDWAFSSLTVRPALDVNEPVTEVRVLYSTQQDTVRVLPSGDVRALLPKGGDLSMVQRRYDLPKEVEAPIAAGQELGSVTLLLSGKEIGTVTLYAERDIERNTTLFAVQKAGGFFSSTYFKVLVVLVVVVIGGYAALVYYAHQRRKKHPPPGKAKAAGDGAKAPVHAPAKARPPAKSGGTADPKQRTASNRKDGRRP